MNDSIECRLWEIVNHDQALTCATQEYGQAAMSTAVNELAKYEITSVQHVDLYNRDGVKIMSLPAVNTEYHIPTGTIVHKIRSPLADDLRPSCTLQQLFTNTNKGG